MALLYGGAGFTGALVAAELKRRGVPFVIAGRSAERVERAARAHGVPHVVFGLDAPRIGDAKLVLNCAGPFAETAVPLARAAIDAGVPYLDLAGEADEHAQLLALDRAAIQRGVTLLPGVGFGVVATEPLAALAIRRHGGAVDTVELAYETRGGASRGTLATVLPALGKPGAQRVRGALVPEWAGASSARFALGRDGADVHFVSNPWRADLVSVAHAHAIPTVRTYATFPLAARVMMATRGFMASSLGRAIVRRAVDGAAEGPSSEALARGHVAAIAVARGEGREVVAKMRGPDAYVFTARSAAHVARAVLGGAKRPGFSTPSQVLGDALLSQLEDVVVS